MLSIDTKALNIGDDAFVYTAKGRLQRGKVVRKTPGGRVDVQSEGEVIKFGLSGHRIGGAESWVLDRLITKEVYHKRMTEVLEPA